jgi:hypothetical protein
MTLIRLAVRVPALQLERLEPVETTAAEPREHVAVEHPAAADAGVRAQVAGARLPPRVDEIAQPHLRGRAGLAGVDRRDQLRESLLRVALRAGDGFARR